MRCHRHERMFLAATGKTTTAEHSQWAGLLRPGLDDAGFARAYECFGSGSPLAVRPATFAIAAGREVGSVTAA